MRKLAKFTSLVLSAALAVSMLAGCGNSAKSDKVFKIGTIGPLTGDAAIYGQAVARGAEIAVKEINEAGGINGYKVSARRLMIDWKVPMRVRKIWPVIVNKNGVPIYIPRYQKNFVPNDKTNFFVKL